MCEAAGLPPMTHKALDRLKIAPSLKDPTAPTDAINRLKDDDGDYVTAAISSATICK
jgi:hypothetical protein